MSDPRVVFMGGHGSPPGQMTIRHGSQSGVVGLDWILWRVLSANNRELGRSFTAFSCLQDAEDDFVGFRSDVSAAEPFIEHAVGGVEWKWTLRLLDTPRARSSRGYERLRECHYSLSQFLDAVPGADVITGAEHLVRQRKDHPIPGNYEPLSAGDLP
jgi:hypothetical protein